MLSGVSSGLTGWLLVQAISPRAHVRLARTLPDGTVSVDNKYPERANIAGPTPGAPWVVHLADESGRYRLLAFDFDAHDKPADAAQRDAYNFVALLERLGGLPYLVCESGPSGGVHVWLAPQDGLPASTVSTLARIASRLYPTLDIAPLTNPATGGVRPPGSPHRDGGRSEILYGDTTALTHPTATTDAIHHLLGELDRIAPAAETIEASDGLALVDRRGRLYLPGTKSSLGTAATMALHGPLDPAADASSVLFSALLGAARARWHFDDIHDLLDTAPGLEYARTERHGAHRVPRIVGDQHRTLARHWDRAVRHAASTKISRTGTSKPELTEQAALVTSVVTAARAHMDASPGRWFHDVETDKQRTGYGQHRAIDRLVLLELYQRALDGLTTTVRASGRTLAMSLPFARESARESLRRLAKDGWIAVATPSDGPTATAWSIDPHGVFHKEATDTRAATGLAPVAAPPHETWRLRTTQQRELQALTDAAAHDIFLPQALGPQAGIVYAGATLLPGCTVAELAYALCAPVETTAAALERLAISGLARLSDGLWHAAALGRRDGAALLHGVQGVRAARAHCYRIEQATYAYWLADVAATSKAAALSNGPQRLVNLPGAGPISLGAYPRSTRHQGSWRLARARIEEALVA